MRGSRFAWMSSLMVALAACDVDDVTVSGYQLTDGGSSTEERDAGGDAGLDAAPPKDAATEPDVTAVDALPPSDPEAPSAPLLAELRQVDGRFVLHVQNLTNGGTVAHGADERMPGAGLHRLFVAATYLKQVQGGSLSPDTEVLFSLDDYRAGGASETSEAKAGAMLKLSSLASLTLLSGDVTAEELLVRAVGGSAAVQRFIDTLEAPGIGRYASPCELDRAYAGRLDPRLETVDCRALAKLLREDDARALVPSIFAEAPAFTDLQQFDAWRAVEADGLSTVTAAGFGDVLARLQARTLGDAALSDDLRALLDRALGAGGGGNDLPDGVWISNLQGPTFRGRAWAGLVRGGDAPVAVVLVADGARSPNALGGRFDRASALAWEQVVGPIDLTPPAAPAEGPAWLRGVFLHTPEDVVGCNEMFDNDFEALLVCRRDNQRLAFAERDALAATVMVKDGPAVEATWLWTEPEGARHRYQVRLNEGGWWAWTRSYPAQSAGTWRLDVWLNGRPVFLSSFPVAAAPAP